MENSKTVINSSYYHKKLGQVPTDWDITSIGESFDFFPTSSFSREKLNDIDGCGYVHYGDIHTKFDRFIDLDRDQLPFIEFKLAEKYTKILDGDLIISDASEDYEGVGKAVEVINTRERCLISGLHTLHLRQKNGDFIIGFPGYLLSHEKVRLNILRSATGIKVYSVSKTELKRIEIPIPSIPEQTAILSILLKIDKAIVATETTIKAAEKLKKVLMQNLLTGKLKPDGTWRNENDLKITKYGFAAKEWLYCQIKDLIKEGYIVQVQDGNHGESHPVSAEFVEEGIPFVMASDISEGFVDLINSKKITKQRADKLRIGFAKNGDVLLSHKASIGYTCIVQEADPYIMLTPQVTYYRVNPDLILPEYLHCFFQLYSFQQILEAYAKQSTRNYIGITNQKKLWIYLPTSIEEQREITKPISNVDEKILLKKQKIKKLQKLKKAMMQNLLTGKVRLSMELIRKLHEQVEVAYV
ncbi:restriction endonuclease subunit S [Adhaeribacter soli]|uniref:Type I restriction modification DNA specificity domain-containing protein n=1 Tax=Adhaeribacter soli TaxID=2607655 RepID=A0A5N1INP4_9BACT|nr:restriction endonuclease subunit S [Adhaeribacter soli]KAA9331145.1 hypothetical protein F0P94_14720 [Adhaeribacter soli]